MKVFLSWSGPLSKAVAEVFHDWLPTIINAVEPWLSSESISKGVPWIDGIKGGLSESNGLGLFFLTKEALTSPWMLFEAGSVSALGHERVCTVYVDVTPEGVSPPFSLFQGTKLDHDDVSRLMKQLNQLTPTPLAEKALDASFNRGWKELEEGLAKARITHGHAAKAKTPSTEDLLMGIRTAVSRIESRLGVIESIQSTNTGALSSLYSSGAVGMENLGLSGHRGPLSNFQPTGSSGGLRDLIGASAPSYRGGLINSPLTATTNRPHDSMSNPANAGTLGLINSHGSTTSETPPRKATSKPKK